MRRCMDELSNYAQAMKKTDLDKKNFWETAAKLDNARETIQDLELIMTLEEKKPFGNLIEKVETALEAATDLKDALDQELLGEADDLEEDLNEENAAREAFCKCKDKEDGGGDEKSDRPSGAKAALADDEGGDADDDNDLEDEIDTLIAKVEAEMEEILELLKQELEGAGEDEQSVSSDVALIS
jgi:hypothetical protein